MGMSEKILEENWPSSNGGITPHPNVFNLFKELFYHSGIIDGLKLGGLGKEQIKRNFVDYLIGEEYTGKYSTEVIKSTIETCLDGLNYGLTRENLSSEEARSNYLLMRESYMEILKGFSKLEN